MPQNDGGESIASIVTLPNVLTFHRVILVVLVMLVGVVDGMMMMGVVVVVASSCPVEPSFRVEPYLVASCQAVK